jgi:molecular chaperone GrpE
MKDRELEIKLESKAAAGASAEEKPSAEESPRGDAEVAKVAAELDEMRQSLIRHQADFANYRKRAEKENREAGQRATARVIEALIPVVDGFEHALAAHREAEYDSYRKGFELIYKQLLDNLTRLGAERVDPLGKAFDPHLHQAVDREEASEHQDGEILAVFQPGYLYHGRVLRPAMVRVAVHPNRASNKLLN